MNVPATLTPPGAGPHNHEVEAALLAAIMSDNTVYDDVAEIIGPQHFHAPVFGRIFAAIGTLINRNEYANAGTLSGYFESDPDLVFDNVKGGDYLYALQDSVLTIVGARDYAKTLLDYYQRRQLLDIAWHMQLQADRPEIDVTVQDLVADAEQSMHALISTSLRTTARPVSLTAVEAAANVEAAYKARHRGETVGIATGLTELDRKLGGLRETSLYILAGATGQGKSALAGTIARHAGEVDKHVLFASLEMSADQLSNRWLSQRTGIPVQSLERGDVDDKDMQVLFAAAHEFASLPIDIFDAGAASLTDVRSLARRKKLRGELDLLIVDYLQLLEPPTDKRHDSRVQEVSAITRGLKQLAMDLEIPVLALSQLSRAVDQRDDHWPRLSDLRESGSIEQDANVIIFVHREEYYLERQKPRADAHEADRANWQTKRENAAGKADLIIAKFRQGATGVARVAFDGPRTLFKDIEDTVTPEQQRNMEALL